MLSFIPSDSYYFYFYYLPPFSFSYSFLPTLSSSLSSTYSFLLFLSLSSFFSSSYSPSSLHSPSPFPHHSLLHISSSVFIPLYPLIIRPILTLLFFFLFSFHLFFFSWLPFSFIHFSVPFSSFFSSFSSSSFFLPFHSLFLYYLPLLPFSFPPPSLCLWFLLLYLFVLILLPSISLLLFRTILFRIFLHFLHSSVFSSYSLPSRPPLLCLLPLFLYSLF